MGSLNQSHYELIAQMQFYTPRALALFNYLNGRINKKNICIAQISGFDDNLYACFQYPNHMTIYLGSVIDHYGDINNPDSFHNVMSVTTLCLAHELFHADQNINAYTYKQDIDYCNRVENGAEYNAEKFCFDHKDDFLKLFGFEYRIEITEKKTPIERATIEQMVLNCFLGFFRNKEVYSAFKETCDQEKNLDFCVYKNGKYMNDLILKNGGKWVVDIAEFNKFLDSFRPSWYTPVFYMSVYKEKMMDSKLKKEFMIFTINLKNVKYYPLEA